jgi:soluble lytic murein transglycosylase-like protein
MAGKSGFIWRAALVLCLGSALSAQGQDLGGAAPDGQGFTFKRVTVPQSGQSRRITVQIDPAAQAAALAALPKVPLRQATEEAQGGAALSALANPASTAAYSWYWDLVDPARKMVSGRFERAISALSQGPRGANVAAPRLQAMQGLAQSYGTDILKATVGTSVSPALVLAVISVESGGRTNAVSPKGAAGLMQLIPATAARFGVVDSTVPAQNIQGGVAYLDWLMGQFDRDPLMVLAAYNAGEGAVSANDGIPPYAETRDYVPKVLAAWTVAQGLCASPPMLVTDPCVFKVIAAGG